MFHNKSSTPIVASTITCHAWNSDKSLIALCPNTNDIEIYATGGHPEDCSKWTLKYELREHDHHVTAIDWAPNTNRILSCSHDRNAYVWSLDPVTDEWKPTLVLLRFNRAATCCKWSPRENKFAVGSGGKVVSVCSFDKENNWWVAKMIKKPHKSTILSVAWHPTDNSILATASSDFKCRIFNAWIKKFDDAPAKGKFGDLTSEFVSKGWVHDVQFSPNGSTLAFLGHDSTVAFVDVSNGNNGSEPQSVKSPELPFMSGLFLSESAFVAVGYDFSPVLFSKDPSTGEWALIGKADEGDLTGGQAGRSNSVRDAFAKFQTASKFGSSAGATSSTSQKRHTNTINCIKEFETKNGAVTKFTTSGIDGRVVLWKVEDLVKKFGNFRV